ncbi:hypothetical protein NLU13_0667 [Sarocladium strictum]|uniref:Mannan endo-1,6-alpha-mannosidase n=1 Tax=Sarocladium strictum TaxID=5046 RepID=A0AA39GQ92_SARSR|nr:hypothetical protein NLU13_0667 [Sarocladium strictum]
MPGGSWSRLFTRAAALVFYKSVQPDAGDTSTGGEKLTADLFTRQAKAAIETLNDEWYNVQTGIWDDAWWNSGNAFTTLADFAILRPEAANEINVGGYLRNTYVQAQTVQVQTTKNIDALGKVSSFSSIAGGQGDSPINGPGLDRHVGKNTWDKRQFAQFRNDFYDDMGWWALGLIRAFDVTGDRSYLDSAIIIFDDFATGLGGPCKGGVYWSRDRKYVNAITNELYLSIAASLANRIPSEPRYLTTARGQWDWFKNSGMINSENLINDGLDDQCKNNGMQTWSYNQGVILGGLVELHRANRKVNPPSSSSDDSSLLEQAKAIARAAIKHLSNPDGILVETDKCELRSGNCGKDGQQFKGIFVRNLRYLHDESPEEEFRRFILDQAVSVWENDREKGVGKFKLGVAWAGPFVKATGASQSCALDALVAAIAVV